jgi:predicted Ser/Thr protein kinase
MTGFSEMIPVEKAYRVLSVEGCEAIGQGANGKVYRIDADTIIKVYNNPDSLPDIKRERELARKAFVKGIPTAIPYDVVKVGNGYGSVFELLSAKSFSKLLMEDPSKIDEIVKMFIDLLKKIHNTNVEPGEMPDKRAVYLDYAHFLIDYLPKDQADKLTRSYRGGSRCPQDDSWRLSHQKRDAPKRRSSSDRYGYPILWPPDLRIRFDVFRLRRLWRSRSFPRPGSS